MTIAEYFKTATPSQKAQYERVSNIVKKLVPDAEEVISYDIPTFKYKGKYLIYFSISQDHLSVYPTVGGVEPTPGTKGTFQFTEENPVPEEIVQKIVKSRKQVIEASR